jgi:DNA-binding CsgD family transcriptional regulator
MGVDRGGDGLVGRRREIRILEELAEAVTASQGRALVVRGEAGIGKSALVGQLVQLADGLVTVRAVGVESEMELPFGGLHQLCGPLLDVLPKLPRPQQDALATVFGFRDGAPPDRLLVALATLSLVCEAAEQKPLLCVVDDGHWLDRASAQVLAFVGRRLHADPVGLVITTRGLEMEFTGIPELVVGGLGARDAMALLRSLPGAPLDAQVRDRIVAEARGNPLALSEWRRAMTPVEAVGGLRLPSGRPLSERLEESFRRRLAELPVETQQFLLVAAAEPVGDAALVWGGAAYLGVGTDAVFPAVDAGLVDVGTTIRFAHPLVRSAAYKGASVSERQSAHRALAEVMGLDVDPDRRAWHRALATAGPDEERAEELERSAGRAQARGGVAAAAAFLERSAALTVDPEQRARRTIAAASAHLEVGMHEAVLGLLAAVEAGPLGEFHRANVEILRGHVASGWGHMHDAPDLHLRAARRLEPIDVPLARDTYLTALMTAELAGGLARGATIVEVADLAIRAPASPPPGRPQDVLLDGLAIAATQGPAAAAPVLRTALDAVATAQLSPGEAWSLGYHMVAAGLLWDYDAFYSLAVRFLQTARDLGAHRMLPWALDRLALANVWRGDLANASALVGEMQSVIEALRLNTAVWSVVTLAAWRGRGAEAQSTIAAAIEDGRSRGKGGTIKVFRSAEATLCNGLGQYDDALAAAESAAAGPIYIKEFALQELVEAAARGGRPAVAAEAVDRLSESTQASGTDWALGIEARSKALISTGESAEALHLEAIERLARTPVRPEAARAHLVFGEWLRREDRRAEARHHLRAAYDELSGLGMDAFAERARRELAATGEKVVRRTVDATLDLTPQELQIARLAAEGETNPEIGAQLFISARTVEYHLRKVFTKLAVSSRKELRAKLQESRQLTTTS